MWFFCHQPFIASCHHENEQLSEKSHKLMVSMMEILNFSLSQSNNFQSIVEWWRFSHVKTAEHTEMSQICINLRSIFHIFLKLLFTLRPVYPHFHISRVDFNFFNSSPLPPTFWYKTYTRFVTTAAPLNNINYKN